MQIAGENHSSWIYVRCQFGDAIFDLCRSVADRHGRLWISDSLSGRVFILEQ